MFKSYLTIAFRYLVRNKSFSVVNIIGLSVGITACLVMLIFIRYELSFDGFHKKAANTYRVVQQTKFPDQTSYGNITAYPLAEALRSDFSEFATVTQASGPVSRTFSLEEKPGSINRFEERLVLFVDPWYPKVFDIEWLAGNPETALTDPGSVVLTESVLSKCFHNEITNWQEVLGKIILLNGKDPLIIKGVVKDPTGNTSLQFRMLVPYSFFRMHNNYYANNWSGSYQGTTFVELNDPAAESRLEEKINAWKKKYLKPEDDHRISYMLQPLAEIHNETQYGSSPGSYTMPHYIIQSATAIALFILIIASVNFVNMAIALAATRAREVGVRKVLGGSRTKLVLQFAGENTLLILIAVFIAIGLSQVSLAQLNNFLTILNLRLVFQWIDLIIAGAIGLTVILLSAIYPAFVLSSCTPAEALKNKMLVATQGKPSLRKVLIVLQFSIVQFFIIATLVIASQMHYIKNKDLGFTKEAVIMTPAPAFEKVESFRQNMLQQKTVTEVAFGAGPPITVYGIHLGTSFRLPGQSEEEGKPGQMKIGDLNYIDFFELQLIAGRNFSSLKQPFDELVVNEKLVSAMGWTPEEALGRPLTVNEGSGTIVGVLKDFHNASLQSEIKPCVMYNWIYLDQAFIKINTSAGFAEPLAGIEKVWKEFMPEGVYQFVFLDELMERNYASENVTFQGFTVFAALAILIGCLGLFGLMSFITLRKTKEVGIRKVLGASIVQIVTLFSKEFVWLVLIAFAAATPFAYYVMKQWLSNFAYSIPLAWWMFAAGGIIGLTIAVLTVSYQSLRAAIANPVESLRNE